MPRTLAALALSASLVGCSSPLRGGGATDERPGAGDAGSPGAAACDNCPSAGDVTVSLGGAAGSMPAGDDGSSGVKVDDNGNVVLVPKKIDSTMAPLIWVANSAEGTISKIDTRQMTELARYRTGPDGAGSPDPSRTTVGFSGDVVVANRAGASATRIAADPTRCVDRNGNGRIDTSSSGGDVLPWGEDECVLWNHPFAGGSLATAAAFEAGTDGAGAPPVWIGLFATGQMKQLDGADGHELDTVDVSPVQPWGAALDRYGDIWVWGGHVARIDPQHVVTMVPDPPCAYGITVDEQARVWTAGAGCVARYSPLTNAWESVAVGTDNRGLAVDGVGSVWVADADYGVHQIDEASLQVVKSQFLPYQSFVGLAIDVDRNVWAVAKQSAMAIRITPIAGPGPGLWNWLVASIPTGLGPYTYSDMTGYQIRDVAMAAPLGTWRHVFAGCADRTRFEELDLDARVPDGTLAKVAARTAPTSAALAQAPWVPLLTIPGARPPIDLVQQLGDRSLGAALEVEILLQSTDLESLPSLDSVSLRMNCLPPIQ